MLQGKAKRDCDTVWGSRGWETYFNCHTFVLIRNFNIVDMHVKAPNINTIQTSPVPASNNEIVDLTTLDCIQYQMEGRGYRPIRNITQLYFRVLTINKSNIVDRKADNVNQPYEPRPRIRLDLLN